MRAIHCMNALQPGRHAGALLAGKLPCCTLPRCRSAHPPAMHACLQGLPACLYRGAVVPHPLRLCMCVCAPSVMFLGMPPNRAGAHTLTRLHAPPPPLLPPPSHPPSPRAAPGRAVSPLSCLGSDGFRYQLWTTLSTRAQANTFCTNVRPGAACLPWRGVARPLRLHHGAALEAACEA